MSLQPPRETVDLDSLHDHLSKALDRAEDESAKYHIREACQKVVILEATDEC